MARLKATSSTGTRVSFSLLKGKEVVAEENRRAKEEELQAQEAKKLVVKKQYKSAALRLLWGAREAQRISTSFQLHLPLIQTTSSATGKASSPMMTKMNSR